jgi:hypothetical protein
MQHSYGLKIQVRAGSLFPQPCYLASMTNQCYYGLISLGRERSNSHNCVKGAVLQGNVDNSAAVQAPASRAI